MAYKSKQSKFVGYTLDYLKDYIKEIDKEEDPKLYDEVKTIIAAKEFEKMASQFSNPQ